MPLAQQSLRGNLLANPHKVIRDRKKKVEALRTKLISASRVSEKFAFDLDAHLTAATAGAADVTAFEDHIMAAARRNEQLEAKIASALGAPELAAFLANPRSLHSAASHMPDDTGQKLLTFCSAYLGTQAYADMAIARGERAPAADIFGPAAAQLAHQLEADRAGHQQTIKRLEDDLATALASTATLTKELERTASSLSRAEERVAEALETISRHKDEISALQQSVEIEVEQRSRLSADNQKLATVNEQLEQKESKSREQAREFARRLAFATQLYETDENRLEAGVDKGDKAIADMAERLDKYAGRVKDGDRAAAAKTAEGIRVAAVDTEETSLLRSRIEESDSSFLAEEDHVARLQVEFRGHVQAATAQEKRASSLQACLMTVELEHSQLKADAEQHTRDLNAAAAKAQAAVDEIVRIRSECDNTIAASVSSNTLLCPPHASSTADPLKDSRPRLRGSAPNVTTPSLRCVSSKTLRCPRHASSMP